MARERNPDPKYGRFLLPLVIVAMVGGTMVFVNALNPEEVPGGTSTSTTVDAGGTSTTTTSSTTVPSSSTTTTVPPEVAAYRASAASFGSDGEQLVERAVEINEDWDNRAQTGVTFQETLQEMRELETDTQGFADGVAAVTPPPQAALELAHADIVTASNDMVEAMAAMIIGLQDPNTAAGRRQALEAMQAAGDALASAVAATMPPATTTTTTATTTSTTVTVPEGEE
ncbi:MAG: hypothetical protein R3246_13370 [Acidimicrobiia bacterium]|nr:hypothetical protein [Acidimicrobiia bacterium]